MAKINQLYCAFGSHFKNPFLKKYGMKSYKNINEPVLMFGCYGTQIEVAFSNKSKVKIAWAGTDCLTFIKNPEYVARMKARPDIEHIAISNFIKNDLDSVGIPCKLIPIVPMDNSDITPFPLGDSIYIYKPNAYCPHLVRKIKALLPEMDFIDTNFHSYSREELIEVYKKCFIGLRLIVHDGCSNTVMELGHMGRKVFWNGNSPNSIPYDANDMESVADIIRNEYNNRKTADYQKVAEDVRSYLDVGGSFLEF